MGKERVPTVPLVIGKLFALLGGILFFWLGLNLIFSIEGAFSIIVIVYLIMAICFIGVGIYLLYKRHAISGQFFLILGNFLLLFVLLWYLPIYYDGGWYTLGSWFGYGWFLRLAI